MGKDSFARHTRRFAGVAHAPCVYVAELANGVIKIGSSSSARARLMSLAAEVKREHATELLRFHVAVQRTTKAAYEIESVIVNRLGLRYAVIPGRREFFVGLTFARAVRFMKDCLRTQQSLRGGEQLPPLPAGPSAGGLFLSSDSRAVHANHF